jgi:dihydrofolate synthase/folylpolyglutamate synthase
VIGVIAILADKDVDGVLAPLAERLDGLVATATPSDRALSAAALAERARAAGLATRVEDDPTRALAQARAWAGEDGAVVVTGSLTLLAALVAE